MITIQSAMLVALGFLCAALIALVIAPAYRRRSERLATDALRRAIPMTEAEIRADKDRLRAEYAIAIHRLEMQVSEGNLSAARQRVELNRRDAAISDLEGDVARLKTTLEEQENARRVLEQTLTDRLPKVEGRLSEAKKMLMQRDREITTLTQSTGKQASALEEATQINSQLREEVERLNEALTTRAARNRDGASDARFDAEVALRSEIEALRAKNRDQASHIARLQGLVSRRGPALDAAEAKRIEDRSAVLAGAAIAPAANGAAAGGAGEGDLARLRVALAESEAALRAAQAGGSNAGLEAREQELRALKAAHEDQATEIARLKAALASYQQGQDAADSRMALKAQVTALKVQTDEQANTLQRLRAELAAANERLARQAQHFQDEMRRLGAGSLPVAPAPEARPSAAETTGRRSLSARIAEPRPGRADSANDAGTQQSAGMPAAMSAANEPARSGFLKAVEGGAGRAQSVDVAAPDAGQPAVAATPAVAHAAPQAPAHPPIAAPAPAQSAPQSVPMAAAANTAAKGDPMPMAALANAAPPVTAAKPADPPRRPRLMDRIAGVEKS